MQRVALLNGQAVGELLPFVPMGGGIYQCPEAENFPKWVRVAHSFSVKIRAKWVLEEPGGRMISGLRKIGETGLFAGDTLDKPGQRSLLVVRYVADLLNTPGTLEILRFPALSPSLWTKTRNAAVRHLTGKKNAANGDRRRSTKPARGYRSG